MSSSPSLQLDIPHETPQAPHQYKTQSNTKRAHSYANNMPKSEHYLAYFLVHSLACLSNASRLFLYNSAAPASTASSGTGSTSSCRAASSTPVILLDGFHWSPFSMPRHIAPCSSLVTFGW